MATTDEQLYWKYMKYEIRTFSIRLSKENAKNTCRNCGFRK